MTDALRRVALDTNVLISALLGNRDRPNSPPVRCFKLAQLGTFQLVTSPPLLDELVRVLAYPKLKLPAAQAHAFAVVVATTAQPNGLVRIEQRLDVLRHDPSDNIVLETALTGRADYLVTGNLRHFAESGSSDRPRIYQGVRILTPRKLIDEFGLGSKT